MLAMVYADALICRKKWAMTRAIIRVPTDFKKIAQELKNWGWGDAELAEKTGVARTKFPKLRSGAHAQPAHDDGGEIMKLYNGRTFTAVISLEFDS